MTYNFQKGRETAEEKNKEIYSLLIFTSPQLLFLKMGVQCTYHTMISECPSLLAHLEIRSMIYICLLSSKTSFCQPAQNGATKAVLQNKQKNPIEYHRLFLVISAGLGKSQDLRQLLLN